MTLSDPRDKMGASGSRYDVVRPAMLALLEQIADNTAERWDAEFTPDPPPARRLRAATVAPLVVLLALIQFTALVLGARTVRPDFGGGLA